MKIWIDGAVRDSAHVSVLDHGLLYGDGVFEGIRVYGGRVFRFDDHLRRIAAGMRALGLAVPGGTELLRTAVVESVRAHGKQEAYVRLVVTRGEGPLGVDPLTCERPVVFSIAADIALFSPEKRARGLDMLTSSFRRPGPDVLDPRVKSLNYLNSVLAKREARMRGADEALLLNARGTIAEASVANVFVVRRGMLLTPPATDGALEGITRASVLEIARRLGIPAREQSLGRMDLFDCDECFLSGTGARLVAVATLDGAPIGGGARTVLGTIDAAFTTFAVERGSPVLD